MFYIKVDSKDGFIISDILKELEELSEYSFYSSGDMICSGDEYKWYDWDKDMIELSKRFPKIRFRVFREYEEGDYMNEMGRLETTHTYREFENGQEFLFEINLSVRKYD